ncbi:MAG TPA: hypothetical protein VF503_24140 [Sphingobium sp.]|uniref:hypothetical protein n=1 Tax=Sphingobium sp. TaxID=1912891 RepID=UPI002ED42748
MFRTIRTSAAKFFKKSNDILESLSGIEDPQYDYLMKLDARIRQIEAQYRGTVTSGVGQSEIAHENNDNFKI